MIEEILERQAVALENIAATLAALTAQKSGCTAEERQIPVSSPVASVVDVERETVMNTLTAMSVKFDKKQSTKYLQGLLERKLQNTEKGAVVVEAPPAAPVAPAKKEVSQEATVKVLQDVVNFPEGFKTVEAANVEETGMVFEEEPAVESAPLFTIADLKIAGSNFIKIYGQQLANQISSKYGPKLSVLAPEQIDALVKDLQAYAKKNPR